MSARAGGVVGPGGADAELAGDNALVVPRAAAVVVAQILTLLASGQGVQVIPDPRGLAGCLDRGGTCRVEPGNDRAEIASGALIQCAWTRADAPKDCPRVGGAPCH